MTYRVYNSGTLTDWPQIRALWRGRCRVIVRLRNAAAYAALVRRLENART